MILFWFSKWKLLRKIKCIKKSWIWIKKSHLCICNKVKLVTAHFLIQKRKKKRLFHSLNSFLFFDRNPWACMIYEQTWLILVYHLNESRKIFSDIEVNFSEQVKFPDFSQFSIKIPWLFRISWNSLIFPWLFFKWHKIPWLFQVPEILGPLATLIYI